MCLNRTSESKVLTIWISRELPLFNFGRLDMWCAWIGHPSHNLWPFEFFESFRCPISSVSIHYAPESDFRVKSYDHLNLSRVLLFNFKRLDMRFAWIGHPSEKFWPLEFVESFCCLISSVSICDSPESDIRVKSCDHLNFTRASVVQFRASRYVMRLNRTSELKVMTIWISWELTLLISSVSICDALELDTRVKNYDHLNFSRAFVVHFERLDMWCAWIGQSS